MINYTLLCLALFIVLVQRGNSYSIELESGEEECFMITMNANQPCSGSYEVIAEDAVPIEVTVTGPDGTVHYESNASDDKQLTAKEAGGADAARKEEEDREKEELMGDAFQFDADKDGLYVICFFNNEAKSDDFLSRTIAFNFRSSARRERDYVYTGLDSELEALQRGLDELKDHQAYMSQREEVHKTTLESINFKVLCWTVLESVILVATTIFQISYVRSFFETKVRM